MYLQTQDETDVVGEMEGTDRLELRVVAFKEAS